MSDTPNQFKEIMQRIRRTEMYLPNDLESNMSAKDIGQWFGCSPASVYNIHRDKFEGFPENLPENENGWRVWAVNDVIKWVEKMRGTSLEWAKQRSLGASTAEDTLAQQALPLTSPEMKTVNEVLSPEMEAVIRLAELGEGDLARRLAFKVGA